MSRHALVLALALSLVPVYAQQPLNPPLKNWAAPLYWAPTRAEAEQQAIERRVAHPEVSSQAIAQAASIFTPPGPMTFIAVTPCRVMDTRSTQPFTGAFGPPSLAAFGTARQVPMPTSTTCSIPANAGAYSLNITVVPPGPMSFLSVWPAGEGYPGVSTINDPIAGGVIANAAIVVAGTGGAIQMVAGNVTDVIIDINGYYVVPSDGNDNTAIGTAALSSNTSGYDNTATGNNALMSNQSGYHNTAVGDQALRSNTTGYQNTATGVDALAFNTSGVGNTANGEQALENNNGNYNAGFGFQALQSNTSGGDNTASGAGALSANTIGIGNTANGTDALEFNSTTSDNTASGFFALQNNNATNNTAIGAYALRSNTTGNSNTATGFQALQNNAPAGTAGGLGGANTATGAYALPNNTSGSYNTAVGYDALPNNTSGSFNIAIGESAAISVSGGNSGNIHIGNYGVPGDNGVIKIGTVGGQTSAYIAGISGASAPGGAAVYVNSNGQLGTVLSSRRFKEQITDMGGSSSKLFQLRPVNFFYKPEYDDGSHLPQYGLIAEEVAKVYPEMVAYDKDGQIMTVKYQLLAPMLLNEVQKQNAQIQKLEDRLAALEALLPGQTSAAPRPAGGQ